MSVQNWDVKHTAEWRLDWGKPLVNDECEYEGDIPQHWGNITARELVHRFWVTVTRGGYAGHGETYMHPDDLLWWAKGGVLRGESAPRIAFLRSIVEAGRHDRSDPAARRGVAVDRVSAASDGDFRLIYFGEHRSVLWRGGLPIDEAQIPARPDRHVGHDDHAAGAGTAAAPGRAARPQGRPPPGSGHGLRRPASR